MAFQSQKWRLLINFHIIQVNIKIEWHHSIVSKNTSIISIGVNNRTIYFITFPRIIIIFLVLENNNPPTIITYPFVITQTSPIRVDENFQSDLSPPDKNGTPTTCPDPACLRLMLAFQKPLQKGPGQSVDVICSFLERRGRDKNQELLYSYNQTPARCVCRVNIIVIVSSIYRLVPLAHLFKKCRPVRWCFSGIFCSRLWRRKSDMYLGLVFFVGSVYRWMSLERHSSTLTSTMV